MASLATSHGYKMDALPPQSTVAGHQRTVATGRFAALENRGAQRRYTRRMSTRAIVVAAAVAVGIPCSCAGDRLPLEIGVTDESFLVEGRAMESRDELVTAIRASGATTCRVRPGQTTSYKRVEMAVLAVRDSGCSSGIVGSVAPQLGTADVGPGATDHRRPLAGGAMPPPSNRLNLEDPRYIAFPLKRILAYMPGSFLVALSSIEIDTDDENGLVLNADGWPVTFDKRSQLVSYSGRAVASFSSLNAIDVMHFVNGKHFEWWVLRLRLRGGKRISVGRSTDDVQVSIAAARIAKVTGHSVSVVDGFGL